MIVNTCNNRYAVNLDWVSYSVRLQEEEPELYCPIGCRLEILPGNNIYRNRWILYDDSGAKIATALWSPYSSVLDKSIATIQIANKWLYEYYGIDYAHGLVMEVWQCTFNAVSRLDIACDFSASDRQLGIIRKLASNAMYLAKKREGSIFWHERQVGGKKIRECHCLSWGAKASEIRLKIYWKSRELGLIGLPSDELLKNGEKPYIVDQWRKADMDVLRVWRIEWSIQGSGQLMWDGKPITLDDVKSGAWAVWMWGTLYNTRFDLRKNQGNRTSKHNNDKCVTLFKWDITAVDIKWRDYNTRERTPDADKVTILRRLMRQLEEPTIVACASVWDSLAGTICTMVEDGRLLGYYQRLFGDVPERHLSALRADLEVGEGIAFPNPSVKRMID